jgi:hypothetical protein
MMSKKKPDDPRATRFNPLPYPNKATRISGLSSQHWHHETQAAKRRKKAEEACAQ